MGSVHKIGDLSSSSSEPELRAALVAVANRLRIIGIGLILAGLLPLAPAALVLGENGFESNSLSDNQTLALLVLGVGVLSVWFGVNFVGTAGKFRGAAKPTPERCDALVVSMRRLAWLLGPAAGLALIFVVFVTVLITGFVLALLR